MKESFTARVGITALYIKRRVHIKQLDGFRSLVEYLDTHESTWINNDELEPDITPETPPEPQRIRFTHASYAERTRALRRHDAVKSYKALPRQERTRANAETIASEHGLKVSTLYKWLPIHDGTLDSVLRKEDSRKDSFNIDERIENIICEILDDLEKSKTEDPGGFRFNYKSLRREVAEKSASLGLSEVSSQTIMRRAQRRFTTLTRKQRTSSSQEAHKYKSHPGHFGDAPYPLSVIQIDHTLLNIIILDDQRRPIGRPWLTLAIDVYSRCVMGFRLSLDPPSAAMVGLVITRAVLPKKQWLTELDPELDKYFLSFYGAPNTFHADNGSDFRSEAITSATDRLEWELDWRGIGQTHWGGHIEALVGNLKDRVHMLPGSTKRASKLPRDYERKKANYAHFTLHELECYLAHEIYGKYHYEWHEGIDDLPVERYKAGLRKGPGAPEVIRGEKARKIELSYLPSFRATIQRNGITQLRVTWWAPECEQIIAQYGTGLGKSYETDFHYKPESMKTIYFENPITGKWTSAQYPLDQPDYSLWELKEANKALAAERRRKENLPTARDAVFRAAAAQRLIRMEAAAESKAARRRYQRQNEDEKKRRANQNMHSTKPPASLPPSPSLPPAVVEDDDVLLPSGRAEVRITG